MKMYPYLAAAFAALSLPALAQSNAPSGGGNQPAPGKATAGGSQGSTASAGESAGATQPVMEGVMKRGPRLVIMRGTNISLVDKAITFPNGMRVDPDGTITRPDRTQATLRPNEMITMAGMLVPVPAGVPMTPVSSGGEEQVTKKTSEKSAEPIRAGEGSSAR